MISDEEPMDLSIPGRPSQNLDIPARRRCLFVIYTSTTPGIATTAPAYRSTAGAGSATFSSGVGYSDTIFTTPTPGIATPARPLGTASNRSTGGVGGSFSDDTNAAATSFEQSTNQRWEEEEIRMDDFCFESMPPLQDITNKRRMSISHFLHTPPTPKRKSNHINYKIKTQPILTADERLAELRQADELKVQKKQEQQEKAKKREEARLAKQAEKEAREAERKRKREENASKKLLQEGMKQRKADEKRAKEAAKRKAREVPAELSYRSTAGAGSATFSGGVDLSDTMFTLITPGIATPARPLDTTSSYHAAGGVESPTFLEGVNMADISVNSTRNSVTPGIAKPAYPLDTTSSYRSTLMIGMDDATLAKQAEKEAGRKRKRDEKASWGELQQRLKERKIEEKREKETAKRKAAEAPTEIYVKLR
ncbi:translation initiation factor IF-2-like isoform X2 [Culex quinquefasciatus]|uniref:translation initiation factor IF-2-like isoform X2 n=1 Tax=Culex quinquefasciatus TaxID=7176 RepID=UPI0018E2F481|nr:translation initiation factor IF-2-like isoform X2 [Culex quinquefasciatus]